MEIINQYKEILEVGLLIGIAVYWSMAFTIIYHLIRFGVGTLPKRIALVFLGGCIVLSMTTILFFAQIFSK